MPRALLLLALCLAFAGPARADVPPIDDCAKEGAACQNAGNEGKSAGVCQKSTCTELDKATGKSVTRECLRCVEGAAPAPVKKSGCSAVPGADAGAGASALWLAAALLGLGRRRR